MVDMMNKKIRLMDTVYLLIDPKTSDYKDKLPMFQKCDLIMWDASKPIGVKRFVLHVPVYQKLNDKNTPHVTYSKKSKRKHVLSNRSPDLHYLLSFLLDRLETMNSEKKDILEALQIFKDDPEKWFKVNTSIHKNWVSVDMFGFAGTLIYGELHKVFKRKQEIERPSGKSFRVLKFKKSDVFQVYTK